MNIPSLPLATSTWGKEEKAAAIAVIESGQLTMSHKVAEFEKCFASYFGSKYAVMVNSGSSANLLALSALCQKKDHPLKQGDEVIVPTLSWSTTYYPVNQCGLKLVFVDIDPLTLNINTEHLSLALTQKTKAIFVPNILGNPADLIEIKNFCDEHNLYLIEDNCESMGATLNQKYAGTYGICGTFSTYFSHHISTIEGGLIVTDDTELYHLMISMRSHGWTRDLPQNPELFDYTLENTFYKPFWFMFPGFNIRPQEINAATGIEQLKRLDSILKGRRQNALAFQDIFSNNNHVTIQQENGQSSWFGFSMIFSSEQKRNRVAEKFSTMNIDCRPIIAGNILKHPVAKRLDFKLVGDCTACDKVHHNGLFVGNHDYPIEESLKAIHQAISD